MRRQDKEQTSKKGGGTVGTGGGPGSCTVKTSGACSYTNFVAAFGSEAAAKQASQICNAESGGVVQAVSKTDIMRNDPQKRAFSFGLFQINLTQHAVGGFNCPAAFNGKNYSATVKNESLYRQCVAVAKSVSGNVQEAVATYKRSNWREWSTGKKCGLAEAERSPLAFLRGVSLMP